MNDAKSVIMNVIVVKFNVENRRLYQEIYNVMSGIQCNYEGKVFKKDKYSVLMEKLEDLLLQYRDLNDKVDLLQINSIEEMLEKIYEIRKKVIDVMADGGCKKVTQILSLYMGYDYDLNLSERYRKLLEFYDNFFVATSCSVEVNELEVELLPYPKTNNSVNKSLLEKIDGADIYFPFIGKNVIIGGYFVKDPLNITRVGGTIGDKLRKTIEQIKFLSIDDNFKNGFLNQLSLRDFLINSELEIGEMITNAHKDLLKYRTKPLSLLVKEFITGNTEKQRYILTLFLLSDRDDQFLAHIIYDMICNTSELLKPQPMAEEIYRSLHYTVQKLFRIAFKNVENRITQLHNLTEDDIPYEKRIAMLKVTDNVKSKALDKLKEMKGTRESSAKAQQYLDGLLKVPFGVYKREPVLGGLDVFVGKLGGVVRNSLSRLGDVEAKTELEGNILEGLRLHLGSYVGERIESTVESFLKSMDKVLKMINTKESQSPTDDKIKMNCGIYLEEIGKMEEINERIEKGEEPADSDLVVQVDNLEDEHVFVSIANNFLNLWVDWNRYKKSKKDYLEQVRKTLNECVYGQEETKMQLERLIAQWMNGKMEGTVFGFQGPPGVGKTTIAKKGLAKCFLDDEGNPRPFGFLPLGGSSNGATLEGHSYTYLGSTWGRIVDILMETKCMNPIIYVDEVDKVSNTEHGREIIGILTHMTDFSQNHEFQDKYFSGIKFDLSKVLFVFSYNDSNAIDRVLRDRITEIKIKALTLNEKIHIVQHYSLPEILDVVGYRSSDIVISKDVIKYIISNYTNEAGVRKLREKLFEIVREINLKKITDDNVSLPFNVSEDFVKELFSDKPKVHIKKIAKEPQVGFVNGLYATVTGIGGLTIVECVKTPSDRKLALELTGQQGDVMKESMMCAKTLAWNLIPRVIKKEINEEFETYGNFGLHIHCPEAATPKDGPSAGITITTAIVSRLCNIRVKNDVAMTGEIDLHGNVHGIGGLEAKLEGAKRAGVRLCLIPVDNKEDYEKIMRRREGVCSSPGGNGGDLPEVRLVGNIMEVIQEALVENELEFINIMKN